MSSCFFRSLPDILGSYVHPFLFIQKTWSTPKFCPELSSFLPWLFWSYCLLYQAYGISHGPQGKLFNILHIHLHPFQLHCPSHITQSYVLCNLKIDCFDVFLKNVLPSPQITLHFLQHSSIYVSPTKSTYHLLKSHFTFASPPSSFSQHQPLKNSRFSFYSYPGNHSSKRFLHSKWRPNFHVRL